MSAPLADDIRPSAGESATRASGARATRSRLFTATAFAGAVLAFALPFGTVESCEGEEVKFTGTQLASYTVPPDDANGTLHTTVESNAGFLAVVVLLVAVLGVLGAITGGRPPEGISATLGVIAMQLLGLAILISGSGGATLLAGFWLALVCFGVAGVVRLAAAVAARRHAGQRVRGYAIGRCVMALSPTLAVLLLIAIAALSSA
jgi:hypothetical protein